MDTTENKPIQVKQLNNGQFEVKYKNLTLIQTITTGLKFNNCTIHKGDYIEVVSPHLEQFKPLFIALHNFKSNIF